MRKKLTHKQTKFVHKYIQNGGNATKAALESYDTNDYDTGSQLGCKNLRLPGVQALIENNFKREELTTDYVLANLKSDIEFTNEPNPYRTRALEMIAKYLDMFGEKPEEMPSSGDRESHHLKTLEAVAKMLEEDDARKDQQIQVIRQPD